VAEDLVRATALSVTTIRRAELTEDEMSMTAANDLAVRPAGVEFIVPVPARPSTDLITSTAVIALCLGVTSASREITGKTRQPSEDAYEPVDDTIARDN
jgi:hypothetical protein